VRVLVVEDDASIAKLFSAVLEKAGHEVVSVADGTTALQRASEEKYDAVICDWMLPTVDGTTVVRELRRRPGRQVAIVLTSCAVGPAVRAHATRAGADEFLPKPSTAAAILASVIAAADKRARMNPPPHPLATSPIWTGIAVTIAEKLRDCAGLTFEEVDHAPLAPPYRAALYMLDAARDTELQVGLFAEHDMGTLLAARLVGAESPDAGTISEVLAELGNNVCGGIKMRARDEGYMLTIGLPIADVPIASDFASAFAVVRTCRFAAAGLRLDVIVGVQAAPVRAVESAHLSEEMVLAEDVMNATGVLVAAKGTRLTSVTAERIARHAPKRLVRICTLG
jgi:CheY-like chemotaxis protein